MKIKKNIFLGALVILCIGINFSIAVQTKSLNTNLFSIFQSAYATEENPNCLVCGEMGCSFDMGEHNCPPGAPHATCMMCDLVCADGHSCDVSAQTTCY